MEFHEICTVFPEMLPDEFRELQHDIAVKGVLEPIWTHDGKIIDGRNRYKISRAMGINAEFREWDGEGGSLLGFVVSKNLFRRQLTTAQKAAIAAEVKPRIEAEIREELRKKQRESGKQVHRGRPADGKGKVSDNSVRDLIAPKGRVARDEAAKMIGVAPAYVSDVERIREASPETFDEVKAGNITIPEAKRKLAGDQHGSPPATSGSASRTVVESIEFVAFEEWPAVKEMLQREYDKWPDDSKCIFISGCRNFADDKARETGYVETEKEMTIGRAR